MFTFIHRSASCILLLLLCYSSNAQSETMFYSTDFNSQSDWQIDDVGSDPPIWESTNVCDSELGDGKCLRLRGQSIISRVTSTSGYHDIRILIDAIEQGNEDGEWCYLQYRTSSTSWKTENLLTEHSSSHNTKRDMEITPNSAYNNQPTFELRLGHSGDTAGDNCYYDNLRVYGIPSTDDPTSSASTNPSGSPSKRPTTNPTKRPSINPTSSPSTNPSDSPSKRPTTRPTNNPTTRPTVNPTPKPTDNPTPLPTKRPTNDPSNVPSTDPSVSPTRPPSTRNPTTRPTNNPSKSPTTPSPTPPGAFLCGETVVGEYNGQALDFTVLMTSAGDITFDMSYSTFTITVMEAFNSDNQLVQTDHDRNQIIHLTTMPSGWYTFKIYGNQETGLTYDIRTTCTTDSPTPAPTNLPSIDPTPWPVLQPTSSPNTAFPTIPPTSSEPNTVTDPPSTFEPSAMPTLSTLFSTLIYTTLSPTDNPTHIVTIASIVSTDDNQDDDDRKDLGSAIKDDFNGLAWVVWVFVCLSLILCCVMVAGVVWYMRHKAMTDDGVVNISINTATKVEETQKKTSNVNVLTHGQTNGNDVINVELVMKGSAKMTHGQKADNVVRVVDMMDSDPCCSTYGKQHFGKIYDGDGLFYCNHCREDVVGDHEVAQKNTSGQEDGENVYNADIVMKGSAIMTRWQD